MKKLILRTREIGSVNVFDLEGCPTQETLQEIAWKIQKQIRRHRMQRVILNLQRMPSLDSLGMRKLLAACLRPQRSLIFGASSETVRTIEDSYLPMNVRICNTEIEVADDLGPFLLEKEVDKKFHTENSCSELEPLGKVVERRRSKRMHVAIPAEFTIIAANDKVVTSKAIVTNISEGGLYAEYLDLDEAIKVEEIDEVEGEKVSIKLCPCTNFPEEYHLKGVIMRREYRKKQLGLAIKFIEG